MIKSTCASCKEKTIYEHYCSIKFQRLEKLK